MTAGPALEAAVMGKFYIAFKEAETFRRAGEQAPLIGTLFANFKVDGDVPYPVDLKQERVKAILGPHMLLIPLIISRMMVRRFTVLGLSRIISFMLLSLGRALTSKRLLPTRFNHAGYSV